MRIEWAVAYPALDHVLQLHAIAKDTIDYRGIFSLIWHETKQPVVSPVMGHSLSRKKINQRRFIHIRSFWERGKPPPSPDLTLLCEFAPCDFIDALVKFDYTSHNIAPEDTSAMPRAKKLTNDTQDEDWNSVEDSVYNPSGSSKGAKEAGVQLIKKASTVNQRNADGLPIIPLKRGSNPAFNMVVGVNTKGRTSDDGKKSHWSLFIIQRLLHPGDKDKVCANGRIFTLYFCFEHFIYSPVFILLNNHSSPWRYHSNAVCNRTTRMVQSVLLPVTSSSQAR